MANNDRVSELYRGEIFGREAQRICRERIHWMVEQCEGPTVLDIGCSQGIASILAAREGFQVVGLDAEEPAIVAARADRAAEPRDVQDRLEFVRGDVYEVDLGQRFDTVLVGEVLEHHADPRRFLERAVKLLARGGTIVITTPFGLHVHHDHRFTFYLSDFAQTVKGLCRPASIDVVDGIIRFTGRHKKTAAKAGAATTADDKKNDTRVKLDKGTLLALDEAAFADRERRTYEQSLGLRKRLATFQRQLDEATRAGATLGRVKALEATLGAERERADGLERQRNQLAGAVRDLQLRPRGMVGRLLATVAGAPQPAHGGATNPPSRRLRARPLFPAYEPALRTRPRRPLLATILDEFSHSCFEHEAALVPLDVNDWSSQLQSNRPAFVLAESAWRGNSGQWRHMFTKYDSLEQNPLRELLAWCRHQELPTVFWNKEDPPNFEHFKTVAREFDYIFTTDADCIPRYQQLCGHDRVYALPFAAQPVIHNPISDDIPRAGKVCFAGSWRADKYPERVEDSKLLLTPAFEFGLDIFDRNADKPYADRYKFPEPFQSAVRGSLAYPEMLTAYRAYKVFLNVNSVTESPTMFARRVFELMACGTPVVSSRSRGIEAILGDSVGIAASEQEARTLLRPLVEDEAFRSRFAHTGYRLVMSEHTYAHRLRFICERVGAPVPKDGEPHVTVVASLDGPTALEGLDRLLAGYAAQIHAQRDLVLVVDEQSEARVAAAASSLDNVTVAKRPSPAPRADALNLGLDRARGEYVAVFHQSSHYGPHYLSDLLLTRHFTPARVVGKHAHFAYAPGDDLTVLRFSGHDHRHDTTLEPGTLLIERSVFDQIRFPSAERGPDTPPESLFVNECRARGIRVYGADPYSYIAVPTSPPTDGTDVGPGLCFEQVMI